MELKKDKRGFFPVIGVGLAVVIAIVVLMTFIFVGGVLSFLKNNFLMILGAGVLLGGFIFLIKGGGSTKVKTTIFLIIVSVAVLFALGGGFLEQTYQGTSFLSISNVEIEDLGERIIVYGVSTGAQELIITPNDINKYILDDGYEATQTVTGSFLFTKQEKEFVLTKNVAQNFRSLAYKTGGLILNCQNNIPSGNSYLATIIGTGLTNPKVCVYSRSLGTNADFLSATGKDLTELSINIGGATGILKPAEKKSITLSDGTIVTFVGSLNSVDSITVPQADALYDAGVFKKLISDGSYQLHEGEEDKFTSCAGISGKDLDAGTFNAVSTKTSSKITSCIQDFNVKVATDILNDITGAYADSVGVDEPPTFTQNSIRVNLKRPTSYPTFTIELDASKVAIRKLKGKPDIVSCVPNKEVFSGDTYISSVSVKNIGKTGGEFGGNVQCTGEVSGSITSGFAQKEGSVNLPISVSGTNTDMGTTYSSSCKVTIEDSNGGGTDTCTFTLGVKYQGGVVCVPNSIKCASSTNLRTCNSDGSAFTDSKCSNNQVCKVADDGTGSCEISKTCSTNSDCEENEECKNNICVPKTIEEKCSPFEQWVEVTTEKGRGPLGIGKWFGWTKTETTPQCILKSWVLPVVVGIMIFGLMITAIMLNVKKPNKRKKR